MRGEELNVRPFESLINVAQLLSEPIGSSQSYCVDELVDEQARGLVQGKMTLIHSGNGVLVRAELTVKVELTCSRCLNDFVYPVNLHIEEEFFSAANVSSASFFPEDSTELTVDNHNILDLGEIIRQYTLLNLPMKPICQPDCTGIKEVTSYGCA